jgi:hypothetical protein
MSLMIYKITLYVNKILLPLNDEYVVDDDDSGAWGTCRA